MKYLLFIFVNIRKYGLLLVLDLASTWWDEYCHLYPDYIPTTWEYLKLGMRNQFVPSYYTRNTRRKLEYIEQGSDTMEEYYDDRSTLTLTE